MNEFHNTTEMSGLEYTSEPTTKTITIRTTTWRRLKGYGVYGSSTFDTIITSILDKLEGKPERTEGF